MHRIRKGTRLRSTGIRAAAWRASVLVRSSVRRWENVMKFRVFGVILAAILVASLHAGTAKETSLSKPFYIDSRSGEAHLSLNGEWALGYRDAPVGSVADLQRQKWIKATVPVSAQWALYEAGILPYPYAHLNTRKYTWVPDKVWYYRRTFAVPAAARERFDYLCFDGAGYFTRIWL